MLFCVAECYRIPTERDTALSDGVAVSYGRILVPLSGKAFREKNQSKSAQLSIKRGFPEFIWKVRGPTASLKPCDSSRSSYYLDERLPPT